MERVQEEAELGAGFLAGQPDNVEHFLLHVGPVDTDRATADLVAVADQVVGVGEGTARLVSELVRPLRQRRGEGVVHRGPAACPVLLEHWRVHHPGERPGVGVDEPEPLADLQPRGTEQGPGLLWRPGREENRAAGPGSHGGGQPGPFLGRQVPGHGPGIGDLPRVVDEHVGQPAGAPGLGPVLPGVQLPARLPGPAGHDHRPDVGGLEDTERGLREKPGHVDQLTVEAQVGLVGSEPGHGVGVGDLRDRPGQLVPGDLGPQPGDQVLGDLDHVLPGDEAHLDVHLGELGLPVGPEVLVTETAGQLPVPLQAADHQQLLEQLRGLGQRVPVTGLQPHRDQEVPGPLGRGPGQVRRLHVHEAMAAQDVGNQVASFRADAQRGGRLGAPHVQVAVAEPGLLVDLGRPLDRERQRVRLAEDLQLVRGHLDLSGGQLGVLVARRPAAHLAGDLHAELGPQRVGGTVLAFAPEHDLDNAAGIAQVDEGDAAVIPAAGYPARQRDRLAVLLSAQRARLVRSDHFLLSLSITAPAALPGRS